MNGSRSFITWLRVFITAALATTLSVAINSGGGHAALEFDTTATGGTAGIGDLTRFQIDGDRNPATASNSLITNGPGVTGDWDGTPYGPQPIGTDPSLAAPAGIGSTGILPLLFADIKTDDFPTITPSPNPAFGLPGEPEFCTPNEEDAWVGGEKFQNITIDNPLFNIDGDQALQCANVLGKGDLFSTYAAYETVAVPSVYGDPNSGTQNHVIVYGAWERGEVPGELNFYIPIIDEIPGNSANDLLIAFDYDSSAPAAYRILKWNGTAWYIDQSGTAAVNGDVFSAAVGFADGTAFAGSNQPSFGEFALDITAAGVLPGGSDGQCVELTTGGYVFTETGNSANAQLKDYVGAPKIPISNCSSMSVTKAGPAGVGPILFDYRVEQQDSLNIFPAPAPDTTPPSTVNQINSQFSIGDTQTWNGIFAQSDYVAFENPVTISGAPPAALPTGWEMISVDCTYIDGFNPTPPLYQAVTTRIIENGVRTTDTNGDLTVVQVHSDAFYTLTGHPGYVPSCTITNDAAGVIIEKAGLGDLTQDFTFDANGQPATLKLTESTFIPFDVGTSVTITEADPGTTPGWDLESIECTDSSGVVGTVDLGNREVTVTTNGSDDKTTCVFTNNQSGRLIVEKVGAPAGSSFDFDTDVADGNLDGASDLSLAIPSTVANAGAFETGDIAPGTYTITELLAAVNAGPGPDVIGSAVCSGETPVAATTGDVVATVTVDPGETATCTFSNTQNGRIIVEKSTTNGDGTFAFDLPGAAGDGSITTTNGNGDSTLVADVAPGTGYSVSETIPAGWDLDSATCVGDLGATGTLTNGETSGSIDGIAVAAGETVTCSFENTRETATLTLTKAWGPNAEAGDSVTLNVDGDDSQNGASPDGSGSSAAPGTTTPATLTVYPGETVSLEEVFGANTGDYLANLTCDNAAAGTLTYTALDLTGSFAVVADDPANVTCTFANTRTAANLTLEKVWTNGFTGDADRGLGADTTGITATSSLQSDSTNSTAGEATASSVTVSVLSGSTVDLSESFGTNTGSYTTDLSCTDANGLAYTAGDLSGTYTMPMTAADVTCTFTNTRTSTDLTLTKSWTNAAVGDSVDLTATGEAGTDNGTNAGDGTTTDDATLTVYSGEEVDLAEAFNPGDDTWYNTSLECGNVGTLTYTTDALTGELVVPTADADGDGVLDDGPITCTFSNVRRTANVVVVKDIVPDSDGGLFNLSINGGSDVTDGGDGASSAPVEVFVGDPVTVSEAAGTDTDLANYTPTLACPSVTLDSNTGSAGGFDVPNNLADGATITCTFTNTRRSATLTLTKDWVNGAAGDAVSLIAGGDSGNSVDALGSSTAPDTDSDAVLTIWAGEEVTLTEAHVPANVGSYDADLVCVDAAGAPVALTSYTAGDLSGTYDVPSAAVDLTCTFTNTRTSAELTLRKAWVNGASGDTADLDVTNQLGQTPADGNTSTSNGTIGTQTDTTNVVTATVLSGEQVTLDELLGAGNTGAYTSALSCGNGAIGTTTGTYTMPKTPADATCTFTNTRTSVTLTVDKVWVDAVLDDTTEITVTGDLGAPPATSTATGAVGSETDASVVSLTVLSGETVDLAETLGAGNTALYTSLLKCDAVGLGTTSGEVTVAKDATEDVSCVFTNTAKRGSITIIKNVAGESDTFSFEGSWDGETGDPADFTLTPPNDGLDQTTFNGVLVPKDGQPYSISEIDPGVNFGTTVTCTGDTVLDGTASGPATATAGLVGSIGLDDGEHITCVFNNTQYGIVIIEKVIANAIGVAAEADFSFTATGLTPTSFDLDDDAGDATLLDAQTFNNVVPGGAYSVTETVPAGWTLTSLVCDDSQSTTPSTTDGATATINVDPAEVVRCTYTNTALESDAQVTKTVAGVTDAIDWSFAFTITPNDAVDAPVAVTGAVSPATGSGATTDTVGWSELVPGASYTIAETTPNAGYTADALTCNVADTDGNPDDASVTFIAPLGDANDLDLTFEVLCDITNTAVDPTLEITKTTVGDVGTFTFAVTPTDAAYPVGPIVVTTTTAGVPVTSTAVDLQAGVGYTAAELPSDAWVEGDLSCTVTDATGAESTYTFDTVAQPGDEISCEITNTKRARIIVEKATVPADTAGDFGFEATWNGTADGVADFTLAHGGSDDSGYLDPGVAYTVSELDASGFALTGVVCDPVAPVSLADGTATVTPTPGQTVTCTFENTLRGAVTIDKVANPASISRVGTTYTVQYDLTVGNLSYIDESFDLSDAPAMASNVTITSIVVNGEGLVNSALPIAGGLIVDDGTVPARAGQPDGPAALVYTVTVEFTMTPSTTNQTCVTDIGGNGAFNSATVTFDEPPTTSTANDCVDLPEPDIDVTKVADGTTATQVGDTFQYEAEYTVTVTNDGEGPGSYTLTDLPGFALGASIDSVTIVPTPVTGTMIEPDGEDVYAVTVLFTVAGDMDTTLRECGATPTPGQGGYNSVSIEWGDTVPAIDDDCVSIPDPDISVTKVRTTDEATHVADDSYRAVYTVTVSNDGDGPGVYSVSDLPDFGTGASVTSVTIDPVPVDGTAIEAGGSDVYTVTVDFTVAGDMELSERECSVDRDTAGQGAYNGVTVTWNDGETSTDEDCVDIPDPNVDYDKIVVGDAAVFNGGDEWTVTYQVEVTNLDPATGIAGPAEYDLTDTFDFGPDVTVDSVVVTPDVPGFTGVAPNNVLADDMTILRGETHTYTIVVDVTITAGDINNGDCTAEGGLHNDAGVSVATDAQPLADQSACASYSTLTLIKQLSDDDDGGNATVDDFTLTASQSTVTVLTGTTPVAGSVDGGDYELTETQLPGYVSPGYTCGDAVMDGQTVTVPLGANVVCTIINDDLPVDLELTKDDGGFAAVAGGDPIPYTITVQNVGGRDADLGEPVTMTDELPAFLSWNDYPAVCSAVGQVLTCDIDPALMGVGDPAVVIDTLVDVAPDAPSGVYENRAWVTTEDDPVCEGAECVPPPCEEAAGNNNVDCDTTPVDRVAAIDIIKVDDVADGDSVFAGDSYGYELLVTNLGPSTILPGAVVTDDLPGQLSLVSVDGGAGWTCNDADPIECTYAPELAPGEVAPTIIVEVTVNADATGEFIDNVADVIGAVDRDCSGLLEAFEPACNEVTDSDDERTPLIANADMAIVKTASVAQIGAGNTFDFELDVTNNGPATAFGVVVDDLVPSQVTVTDVSSSFFSCSRSGNDVSCTRASMAVGQSGSITIGVLVPAGSQADTVVNIGTVTADTPDPNLDNNSDDAEVIIVAQIAPTTVPPPTVTLPPTGSNSTSPMLQLGVVFLLLGMVGVTVTRRRDDGEQAA